MQSGVGGGGSAISPADRWSTIACINSREGLPERRVDDLAKRRKSHGRLTDVKAKNIRDANAHSNRRGEEIPRKPISTSFSLSLETFNVYL